ncbi:MAG TPA: DUF362 domain-containing protein [Candidatus Hydrogenedentes bacterium]|nr:DUF362 domain-containing protein [Candidatus Hydrogenedentota bacterium]
MATKSRREFLKRSAACAATASAWTTLGAAETESKPLDMVIVRANGGQGGPIEDNEAVDKYARSMTQEAIKALGGMGRFVNKGDTVWIKPNIAWDRSPEQAANTNPALVAMLVELCLAAGAKKVKVGDNTCNEARKTYPRSGIEAAAKAAGAEMVYIDESRFKDYDVGGERVRKWPVYPEIVESDLVINCPIVKDHSLTKLTACMKNYMGVVGGKRGLWHQNMGTCLTDITKFMKPRLCVLDATRILTAHGPTGGSLADVKRLDTVAAGTDIVALDAFAAELRGVAPADIESIVAGQAAGLGTVDYRNLALKEMDVA